MTSKSVTRSETAGPLVEAGKTQQASKALLAHIQKEVKEKATKSEKKDLLADEDGSLDEVPIWLQFSTKRHIVDSGRKLRPVRLTVPFPLDTDTQKSICVIVAEPQRWYKNLVASDEFPAELRPRISRIIDVAKLKAKFKSYESVRALYNQHDIFLGDARIINRCPAILGKTFYKSQKKRLIPIKIEERRPKVDGKRTKPTKGQGAVNSCNAAQFASEIERAVGSALLNLAPSTNTMVRVGWADWTADKICANAEEVIKSVVGQHIPRNNLRSIYIKGPETVALPLYLTDELWVDKEKDIVGDDSEEAQKLLKGEKPNIGKKRKSLEGTVEDTEPAPKKSKKAEPAPKQGKKAVKPESNDDKLDKEIAERKAALKKQKKAAKKALDV
ncbi:electron transfer flavoprotein alpha-subunit [Xylariaceae sp. FL1272]|nr:electron transfer flavoprotein alpha-subunit [Xylariaceae sp. FL1272]